MSSRWYVLRCKPHKEYVILHQLQQKGYEAYFPCFASRNERSGRLEIKPYFPGYLFVRFDLDTVGISTFQWMPHTDGLVCFEAGPAYVPDPLVNAVQRRVVDLNKASLIAPQAAGESELQETLLENARNEYDAFLDQGLSGGERVNGLLRLLQALSLPSAKDEA